MMCYVKTWKFLRFLVISMAYWMNYEIIETNNILIEIYLIVQTALAQDRCNEYMFSYINDTGTWWLPGIMTTTTAQNSLYDIIYIRL